MNTGLDEVLILNLVIFRAPGFEGGEGFVAEQGVGRKLPLGAGECELVVDERVVEAVLCRVGLGAGEVDSLQTRPVDCGMFEMGTHYVFIQYRKIRSIVVLSKSRLQAMAIILGQSGILLKEMMR